MRADVAIAGRPPAEDAVAWQPADLEGVEAMAARYRRQVFQPHRHDGFLVGVIEAGAHAVWCRGARHLAGPASLATMDPGEVHHGGAGAAGGWRQRMLYLTPAVVGEVLEDALDRPPRSAAPHFGECFRRDRELSVAFVELHALLADGAADPLERQTRFDAVTAAVFLRYAGPAACPRPAGRAPDALERVREYLHAHLMESCPLQVLARLAGLRRRQLVDAFTSRFALPPHRYLTQLRVDTARALLAQGRPPAEVAGSVGFSDQSHFIRRFKAVVGVTPGRYQGLAAERRTFVQYSLDGPR